MILCSCTRLSTADLRHALSAEIAADPWAYVSPAAAFRKAGRKMVCGHCARLVAETLARERSRAQARPPEPIPQSKGQRHEGQ